MAEFVLNLVDKVDSTHPLYPRNYLAGDILAIHEDGWPWSSRELTHPNWRIVKMPGIAADTLGGYAVTREDANGDLVRKRDVHIDLTAVPSTVQTYLANNQVITLTPTQISKVASWIKKHSDVLTVG